MTASRSVECDTLAAILLHGIMGFGIVALAAIGSHIGQDKPSPERHFTRYLLHRSIGIIFQLAAFLRPACRAEHRDGRALVARRLSLWATADWQGVDNGVGLQHLDHPLGDGVLVRHPTLFTLAGKAPLRRIHAYATAGRRHHFINRNINRNGVPHPCRRSVAIPSDPETKSRSCFAVSWPYLCCCPAIPHWRLPRSGG